MKNNLILLIIYTLCAPLFAQIQTGMVREQNSKRRPVGGVQVSFADAVPTTSDDAGNFRLAFEGKKAGDFIFFSEIKKTGYELVNGKELEVLKISSDGRLGVDIILAKAGTVDAAKKEYYQVSDKALLAGFNRKKQELQAQIQNASITQQEFLDKFEESQEQYERQRKSLDALAEKFAKVNFDDVSEVYKEALELFKAGKIDEAIKKLEDADFLARSEKHIHERIRISNATEEISNQKIENEKGIQEDMQAALQQARIYVLKGQFADAVPFYDLILLADGTNLTILQECADFYKSNKMPEKALPLYAQIIAHPEANEEQKTKATQDMNSLTQKKD